jgi:putative redox protein
MAKVDVRLINSVSYVSKIITKNHEIIADEPISAGGTDKGPNPIELALGALGACTTMTIKIYLDQKKWPFESVDVNVDSTVERVENSAILSNLERPFVDNGRLRRIHKSITVTGVFSDDQKERILKIASKCPVNKMLSGSSYITDSLSCIEL